MAKRWLVYAFTSEDFEAGPAKQGLVQAIDPDNRSEVLTLKVSDHDCGDLDDWIIGAGYRSGWSWIRDKGIDRWAWEDAATDMCVPFEWEFDDPVEVVDRRSD